jgi:hypothetical protein
MGGRSAKPDRHLKRFSKFLGYNNVQKLCEEISKWSGDKVAVVNLVLWRFSTQGKNYLNDFLNI